MWLYSTSHEEQGQNQQRHEQQQSLGTTFPAGNAGLRLLGERSAALSRDLQWWTPNDAVGIVEIGKDDSGELEVPNFRVVGYAASHGNVPQGPVDQTRYKRRELSKLNFYQANTEPDDQDQGYDFLATETYDPLKSLYAKHMFSAFMRWAA